MEIKLSDVSYYYYSISGKPYPALVDFNYTFSDRKIYGIFGHTGSGKSTLLQLLIGLLQPEKGKVLIDGEEYQKKMAASLRARVGLVFQYPEHQFFEENIFKEVAFALKDEGLSEDEQKKRVETSLAQVDFPVSEYNIYERSPFELSGGEERKVAIASFLIKNPEILVLDEPTAGLDPLSCLTVERLIRNLKRDGRGVILVSHDILWALRLVDEILILDHGKLIFNGSRREYIQNLSHIYSDEDDYLPEELIFLKLLQKAGFDITGMDHFSVEKLVKIFKNKRKKS
jgi:energy-coupling factor transporter ATP-binding protein EcfA2